MKTFKTSDYALSRQILVRRNDDDCRLENSLKTNEQRKSLSSYIISSLDVSLHITVYDKSNTTLICQIERKKGYL